MPDSHPRTRGAHHVGLTVPDIAAARTFFIEALGFTVVGEAPGYPAVFVSDGTTMLTLWRAADPAGARAFDRRRNIGLHHLALSVPDAATLAALADEFRVRKDVEIEFEPEPLGDSGMTHMMCAIPGGIRLELVAA